MDGAEQWQAELRKLRQVLNSTGLTDAPNAAPEKNKAARQKLAALTPGRQREYAEYIASAKRADTKQTRLDKIMPMIVAGIGLNDKYQR